jgi:hypothetical protein
VETPTPANTNTSAVPLAPRPQVGSIQRVIYNILHDAPLPMSKETIWKELPAVFHKPHGRTKFQKALTNMVYRRRIVNTGTTRRGVYKLNTLEAFNKRGAEIKRAKFFALSKKKAASKRKPKKKVTQRPLSDELVDRIDSRITEYERRLGVLKALRELIADERL